jgi:hypothetical protein
MTWVHQLVGSAALAAAKLRTRCPFPQEVRRGSGAGPARNRTRGLLSKSRDPSLFLLLVEGRVDALEAAPDEVAAVVVRQDVKPIG